MGNVRVVKMIMQESGTYNPMYQRPYQSHIDGHTMDGIINRVAESNAPTIDGALMAGLASNMITPSATAGAELGIPLGWTERRIRFLLEVAIATPNRGELNYYIQGFTSHLGVQPSGAVDPSMEFIINSIILVARNQIQTPSGTVMMDTVAESYHVINGQIIQQYVDRPLGAAYSMRPQDIFSGAQAAAVGDSYSFHNNGEHLTDTRTRINTMPIRSKRANNLPSAYLAEIVDTYHTSRKMVDYGQGHSDIIGLSQNFLHEGIVSDNFFIRELSHIKGVSHTTSFSMGDLIQMDPNVQRVTNYLALGPARAQTHSAGQTAYWNGSDRDTLVATILLNAIPAVMMDLMISKIAFTSTNHDYSGRMNTVISGAQSLTNIDLTSNFDVFIRRLEREIMFDVTYANQDQYMIMVNADLFGDTSVTVAMGSNPPTTYTAPSFCDSLMVPVITGSKDNFYGVVHDFEHLMDSVGQVNRINTVVSPIY
jgi:hypothetical protein